MLRHGPALKQLLADRAYDARKLREALTARGTDAVIPPLPIRKKPYPFDPIAYRNRNLIERMFCRIKDFRRIATRYDKLARNFLAAVQIAASIIWWTSIESQP